LPSAPDSPAMRSTNAAVRMPSVTKATVCGVNPVVGGDGREYAYRSSKNCMYAL
jgi:hypothetical protein